MHPRRPQFVGRQFHKELPASCGKLAQNEPSATAIEHAFIAGLAALAIVAAVTTLGTSVRSLFGSVLTGF